MIKKQFFILGLNSGRKRLLMTEEQSLRMVVKVGTSTLTRDNGSMNLRKKFDIFAKSPIFSL